nr:p22 [Allamanda chlorotic virus A]
MLTLGCVTRVTEDKVTRELSFELLMKTEPVTVIDKSFTTADEYIVNTIKPWCYNEIYGTDHYKCVNISKPTIVSKDEIKHLCKDTGIDFASFNMTEDLRLTYGSLGLEIETFIENLRPLLSTNNHFHIEYVFGYRDNEKFGLGLLIDGVVKIFECKFEKFLLIKSFVNGLVDILREDSRFRDILLFTQ